MSDAALAKLASMLDGQRENLLKVLPGNLSVDRVRAIALSAASRNPKLMECTAESFYIALHTSVSLGLEPNTPLQHAWLIPYGKQATFQLGYKGLLDLCRRTGLVQNIYAYPVRDGDEFDYSLGLSPDINHKPRSGPDKPMTHVYAVCKLKNGGEQFVVMTRAEVEAIRRRSKSPDDGPWVTDFEAMAMKTALKRLTKYLPQSIEVASAIQKDNENEFPELKDATPKDARTALARVREKLQKPALAPAQIKPAIDVVSAIPPEQLPDVDQETGELAFDESQVPETPPAQVATPPAAAPAAPTPEKPKAKEEYKPTDTIETTVDRVEFQNGVNKKTKKPWTLYFVITIDAKFKTFDSKIAEEARKLCQKKAKVTYCEGLNAGERIIKKIEAA